jgi:urease accessory protein
MGSRLLGRVILLAAPYLLVAAPASAHHVMGKTPSTAIEGFLSGLGHPVIGADHLALLLAVGVIVGVARLSILLPAFFIIAMASGVAMHVRGIDVPASEVIAPTSVLLVGVLMVRGRALSCYSWVTLFTIAGVFHGYEFGEPIFGAESSPLGAYVAGLIVVQSTLTIGIALIACQFSVPELLPRLAGVAIGGVGFAVLIGQLVSAV